MRTITALATAAGLLIALTACVTSAPSGDCTPSRHSGDASSLITADGSFGKKPDAAFPTPLVTKGMEVSTVTAGKGKLLFPGEYANFQATAYDGATGKAIVQAAYDPSTPLTIRAGESLPEPTSGTKTTFGYMFTCQNVGSRIAATMKASALYGYGNISETTPGLTDPDATIVVVADIEGSILGKAYGVPQVPQQGMPSVVTDPDGVPGVTIVGSAPKTLKTAVLQQGDGKKVEEGQSVYIHYLRLDWNSPDSFKSTWTSDAGVPQVVLVSAIDATTGAGLTPGLLAAIKGQKVGSQVLAVVPPAFGFPKDLAPEGVDPDATLVYVIDILGIKSK